MTKVYPNANNSTKANTDANPNPAIKGGSPAVLTVWKKSLLFNCDGFTVFDQQGNLVFRVDNYTKGSEIVLMDASGNSLLTIRRKRLSLVDSWLVYEGETSVHPRFTVKKNLVSSSSKSLAHVTQHDTNKKVTFDIEGSYTQRCCAIYGDKRRPVAEIKRKESVKGVNFGVDVFRLIVNEQIDVCTAMAFVILLDKMFGPSITKRFSAC